jgi:8-oxo-dGTP pyrophosphatase MutT (NUDIX family)
MHQTAHAVLMWHDRVVLQLRDDIPGIASPGCWSLFGGAVERGEDPRVAVEREVFEELSIVPGSYRFLWHTDRFAGYWKSVIRYWFFCASVEDVWATHELREGQAVQAFALDDLPLKMSAIMRLTLERFRAETVEMATR